MKTRSLYSYVIFLVSFCFYGQQTTAQGFQKIYKMGLSHGHSIITDDSSIVIAGSTTYSGRGIFNKDMLLMKTDLNGTVAWAKSIGGIYDDVAYRVKKTSDNGYILVGVTNSFMTNDSINFYIVKTDNNGDVLWTTVIGRNYSDIAYDVIEKSDHTYAIVGTTSSGENTNILFLHLDVNGTLLLSREIGGTDAEKGSGLVETADGGYFIVGSTISYDVNTQFPYELPYLVKLSSSGAIQFTKVYTSNSTITSSRRYFTKISKGYDNSYVITGSDGIGSFPVYDAQASLVNIDSDGNVIWAKKYILNSGQGVGESVEQTMHDKYVIGGTMGKDIPALILVDKTGNRLASKIYPGVTHGVNGRGWDAVDLQNNSVLSVASRFEGSDTLVYLIKTDALLSTNTCQERDAFLDTDVPMTMSVQQPAFTIYTSPDSYFSDSGYVKTVVPKMYNCNTNSINENSNVKASITLQQTFSSIDFVLNAPSDVIKQICIYSLTGALLKKTESNRNSISTSEFPAGIYIYQITTAQQEVYNGKFIVH